MTQGSTWDRVLLLGGARTLASISFCHTSVTDRSVLMVGRGRCCFQPPAHLVCTTHTYSAESLVSSQTTSQYAFVGETLNG